MNIGFYISNLESTIYKDLLSSINNYIDNHPYDNVVVFTNQMDRIFDDKFYVLHLSHAKYFDGILFLFDIKDASIAATFPGPKKQIIYATQLYWEKNKHIFYSFWEKIFLSDNTKIIVNNQKNYDIYNICWKQPMDIIEKLDEKGIENVIQKI